MFKTTLASTSLLTLLLLGGTARAEDSTWASGPIDRVQTRSAQFVRFFNRADADALGDFYVRRGVLKLPNQRAVGGRSAVVETWRNALRVLGNLSLFALQYEDQGHGRVLETGEFRLEIRTPDGLLEQRGTFAVTWRVPRNPRAQPRIIFDAIDGN